MNNNGKDSDGDNADTNNGNESNNKDNDKGIAIPQDMLRMYTLFWILLSSIRIKLLKTTKRSINWDYWGGCCQILDEDCSTFWNAVKVQ